MSDVETTRLNTYLQSLDLGRYLSAALAEPTPENLWYAGMAQYECLFDWSPVLVRRDEPTLNPRRAEVVGFREARCAGVKLQAVDAIRAKVKSDPALQTRLVGAEGSTYYSMFAGAPAEPTDFQHRFASFLGAKDAGLLILAARDVAQAENVVLDGQPLTPIESASFGVAVLLATCDLGVPCDRSNPYLARACGSNGFCDYDNLEDLFRSAAPDVIGQFISFPDTRLYSFAVAARLRQRIAQAIRSGDVGFISQRP